MSNTPPTSVIGVAQFDEHLTIQSWNRGAELVTRVPGDHIVGKSLLDLCASDEKRVALHEICAHALEGKDFAGVTDCPWGRGTINLEITPLRGPNGEPVSWTLVAHSPEAAQTDDRHGFKDYMLGERNRTPATAFTYECNLQRIEKWLDLSADEIAAKPNEVRRFIRESDYHPATKNNTLVAVKQYAKFGLLEGFVDAESASKVLALSGPKTPRQMRPALTLEEAEKLLGMIGDHPTNARVVYLGLYAGLRVSESARITQTEWRSDRQLFDVLGKGRKPREVPIHPALETKKDLILGRSVKAHTLKSACRSLSHCLGVPFTSHSLRRTFGQQLQAQRVTRDVISDLLGHAPSVTVQHYVPITIAEKTDAVLKLPYAA